MDHTLWDAINNPFITADTFQREMERLDNIQLEFQTTGDSTKDIRKLVDYTIHWYKEQIPQLLHQPELLHELLTDLARYERLKTHIIYN